VTPIRRQYLEVKRRFPGTIVLFRLGDVSETFDEDECDADQVLEESIGEATAHANPALNSRWQFYQPPWFTTRTPAFAPLLRTTSTAESLWPWILGRG
jgi:MutS domain I